MWARAAAAITQLRSDVPLALLDAALVASVYLAVMVFRFDGEIPPSFWQSTRPFLLTAVVVHLGANRLWGLYRHMWRHASVDEARHILLAGATASAVLALWFLPGRRDVPISVVVVGGLLVTALLGTLRFQSRLFAVRRGTTAPTSTRVVVVGAGEAGGVIVREMVRAPRHGLVPVALVDDDPRTHGRSVAGVDVVGGIDELSRAVADRKAVQAVLAIPSADSTLVRRVARAADRAGVTLRVLPSIDEVVGGRVSVTDVRDLSIDDLLGRQQVRTDLDAVQALLRGRRVLITGAGGSIGSEIARQVAACEPASLVLLDHDETHLHDAALGVRGACEQELVDIRDAGALSRAFERHRPEVVFHAAALKHVPLLERHPSEAVATNVLGTARVVAAATATGVERLVFISTDKAVRPTSVMGASKRLGEQIVLSGAPTGARWCAVRFGNVLGSRGSVIPTFMRQIAEGGPVTVTDPRMTRYFMSIPEAVQLVLQATTFAREGEVFMLDMGRPVRILDLAERMIRLSGRQVGTDVPVRITGRRPGEKLAEELRAPDEDTSLTPHPSVVALRPAVLEDAALGEALEELARLSSTHQDAPVAELLHDVAAWRPAAAPREAVAVDAGGAVMIAPPST